MEQVGKISLDWEATKSRQTVLHPISSDDFVDSQMDWRFVSEQAKGAMGSHCAALRPEKQWGGPGEPTKPTYRTRVVKCDVDPTTGDKSWPKYACGYCWGSPPPPANCPPEHRWMYRNPLGGSHNPNRCEGVKGATCMMPQPFAAKAMQVDGDLKRKRLAREARAASGQ